MKGLTSDKRMLEYGLMKSYSNIFCFSTTRFGGCSEGAYASFNCTHYCGDRMEHVAANKELLASLLSQRPEAVIIPRQTHGTNVRVITSPAEGEGLEDVDAVVTRLPGVCLCVSTADCIPILIYDRSRRIVAAVHAGWRGTVGRIVEKTLDVMHREFATEGKDVVACIGPGISLDAFEVGDEVYDAFREAGFDMERIARREEKWHIDLWEANRMQLLSQGVKEENIGVAGICTYREYETFFSARRLGIRSGRILSGIMLHK
ncbi:MAG: peptidoglycan editing factor PgeF [Bacteroides sp.]|nr:peptidoglycan editing factor PgeF [Bacteroides sp.]